MARSASSPPQATTMRLFWGLVEQTTAQTIQGLADADIGRYFLRQVNHHRLLSTDEVSRLSRYIDTHVMLIRDLTEEHYSHICA